MKMKNFILLLFLNILFLTDLNAQFIDEFKDAGLILDSTAMKGWAFRTGDGNAVMTFSQNRKGLASINVDASADELGIWYAFIRRCISEGMDLSLLSNPEYEFRIEAKIKSSNAPKRVNLHLNTQRTTDFHSHLMEFDIPDTANWHVISMTTENFDALPGDSVYAQLALMDWGFGKYRVDIDYFKVDIIEKSKTGADKGEAVIYHPLVKKAEEYDYHIPVLRDAVIDLKFPRLNFNGWSAAGEKGNVKLLTVSGTQFVIMKWDLTEFKGRTVEDYGILELTSHSLLRSPEYEKDFGMIRICEITGGDADWIRESVTYENFLGGTKPDVAINSQMIIDVLPATFDKEKTFITISRPVILRMIDGKTFGLALKPLGAVTASFYSMLNCGGKYSAVLHFNLR